MIANRAAGITGKPTAGLWEDAFEPPGMGSRRVGAVAPMPPDHHYQVGIPSYSYQIPWLPQGLAAATEPGAISVVLLWLTVTLSNLTSYATALFPLGKMDSHGRAHILTANLGFAFYPPSSMAPCERLRCANRA